MDFYNRLPADYLEKIDIPNLYWHGVNGGGGGGPLRWGSSIQVEVSSAEGDEHYIRLKYTIRDRDSSKISYLDYKIPLVTTACNYGGKRFWFECLFCKRRVGALYLRANVFACRHCNYLTYESKLVPGNMKGIGRIISIPEVEESEKRVKRTYYKGKPTKNYMRYLKKRVQFSKAYRGHLEAITR